MIDDARKHRLLWRIRLAHTAIWAMFALAILAIPLATFAGELCWAFWLSGLVWLEVFILFANRMRCPLTGIAARYTSDRAANFDIFLPVWLARNNQWTFGILFFLGEAFLLWRLLGD